jgi:catechol 2,3-dioxygenase-like lactoylglutathione lyase family enzyme
MILGLSHIGVTVSALDDSLNFYRETLGFTILSDAERKGEWVDKITGIPGFHTRTVYLSVTPYRHMEVFGFFNPQTIPPDKNAGLRVGILYCAFMAKGRQNFDSLAGAKAVGNPKEGPYRGQQAVPLQDPDGLLLRIIEPEGEERAEQKGLIRDFLYPAFLVANIDESSLFFRDVLGMAIMSEGISSFEEESQVKDCLQSPFRWVLFRASTGTCLKLIKPLNLKVLPAEVWKMQRVGFTHVAFGVKNLEEFYLELTTRKVNFKSSPQPVTIGPHQGGKVVYLSTPEGLTLEFIESPLIREEKEGR